MLTLFPYQPRKLLISLVVAGLCPISAAIADDSNASVAPPVETTAEDSVSLETVIVRANPLGRTSDELVQPVIVLSGEELTRKRAPTIGETLAGEPGISASAFGAGASRPVIRGQAGSRVQVLENGLGALDVSDVSPDHAVTISPAQATQVEVIKGPATLLYGSGAAGGVVNIANSRLPLDFVAGEQASFESYYGSNADERAVTLDTSYGFGGHSMLHFDYGGAKAGDYDIPDAANVDGSGSQGTLTNSASESKNGAVSYGYLFGDSSVSASVSRLLSTYGLPNEETAFIKMDQTRYDVQALLDRPFEGVESIKLRGAYNDYEHTEFEGPGEPGTVFTNEEHQERIELVHSPLAGWRGVVGLTYDDRDFKAIGDEALVPSTVSDQTGVFIIEERPVSFGKFELGARHDQVNLDPEGHPSDDFSLNSVSAGVAFNILRDGHLKLTATHAERAPSPEELYAFGPHIATAAFERGLADADIETANNFEIGFDHHIDRWTVNASLWYEQFGDYLYLEGVDQGLNADGSGSGGADGIADTVNEEGEFDPDGALTLYDYRQADANFWGYEFETDYALLQSAPMSLTVRVFTDSVSGELDDGGSNLPRVTPQRYGLGFHGSRGPLHGNLEYTRVDSKDNLAPLETPTDGYNMLSADLSYHFRLRPEAFQDSEIYLRARNLLDEDARVASSFIKDQAPLPGVSVLLGIRLSL